MYPDLTPESLYRAWLLATAPSALQVMCVLPCDQTTWESQPRAGGWPAWVKEELKSPLPSQCPDSMFPWNSHGSS